jgi:antitoxin HigA-1
MSTTTSNNAHRRARTRPPVHPGGILKRHYLEPLGIGVSQAALALGVSRKTLSKILHERGGVTPEMALRLSRAFHTTPELWLNLQRNYDLWQAAHRSERWRQVSAIEALT